MIELLLILTAVALLLSMWVAYTRTRDPLHPLMYLGAMILYICVVRPLMLLDRGGHTVFFPQESDIFIPQLVTSLGIALFCVGALVGTGRFRKNEISRVTFWVPEVIRRRLYTLGCILGVIALIAYNYAIFRSGGYFHVYSRAKGYYSAGSGYIGECVNFAIPAMGLILLSRPRVGARLHHVLLALLFASPLLIHGLLGARRGPTFLVCGTFVVAWAIVSERRQSLARLAVQFALIGLLTLVLFSHRRQIYLGSSVDFNWDALSTAIMPAEEVTTGDDNIFSWGLINTAQHSGRYYWGFRYVVTYLVRPIPKQLWPTKYQDVGLRPSGDGDDIAGFTSAEWKAANGWEPLAGSAAGFVADLFVEFSWGCLIGCFLMGWFYGAIWRKAVVNGGLWTILFIEAAGLSIYVPTQSVSAVFHRFLFMSIPTMIFWKIFVCAPVLGSPAARFKAHQAACSATGRGNVPRAGLE